MNKLKILRKRRDVSQQEVADSIGVSRPTYAQYESGARGMSAEALTKLADYFGVSVDEILGREEESADSGWKVIDPADFPPRFPKSGSLPLPDIDNETALIPILGEVHAGYDYFAEENIEGYYQVEPRLKATYENLYVLRVTGDSMYPEMDPGGRVICAPNGRVRSGDLAIVCINGDAGTVKRVKIDSTGITLIPTNKKYPEIHYTPEEVEALPVIIQSKVIEYRRLYG